MTPLSHPPTSRKIRSSLPLGRKSTPQASSNRTKRQKPIEKISSQHLSRKHHRIALKVRHLVHHFLGVPLADICYATVKCAFDHHPLYSQDLYPHLYPTRAAQVQAFLDNTHSNLTVPEFWQGVYDARYGRPFDSYTLAKAIQNLVHHILDVPVEMICCGTVKQALDRHPVYAKDLYPTRARQTKQLLKDYNYPLTIQEFWQGVYTVRKLRQEKG